MAQYEVIVGNIGTVYSGEKLGEAVKKYRNYVLCSLEPHGRASQESVTLLKDNEIIQEYAGTLDERKDK